MNTTRRTGTVVAFDEGAGVGTIRSDAESPEEGDREHFFHCTQIADGTRQIPPGAPVSFRIVPGRRGRWEAADIVPA
ncbi:MAG: cold-shock protein [Acidimicrobiales bacterium]